MNDLFTTGKMRTKHKYPVISSLVVAVNITHHRTVEAGVLLWNYYGIELSGNIFKVFWSTVFNRLVFILFWCFIRIWEIWEKNLKYFFTSIIVLWVIMSITSSSPPETKTKKTYSDVEFFKSQKNGETLCNKMVSITLGNICCWYKQNSL